MNEDRSLRLKKDIDEANSEISELKGSRKQLMKDLKDNWNCNTLEEAETAHAKLDNDITRLGEKITKGTEELNEKYEL